MNEKRMSAERGESEIAQWQVGKSTERTVTEGMPELIRRVAAEGAVLLENRVLPFAAQTCVAVFGRSQIDWSFIGYGSGGDVNCPYKTNLLQGLRDCELLTPEEELAAVYERWTAEHPASAGSDWGKWPAFYPEMPLTEELVSAARAHTEHAVIVLSRTLGEARDAKPEEYYLTEGEDAMLRQVTAQFPNAVLILNVAAVIDMSFLDKYSFGAVLLVWQGGMESGSAVADLLCGKVTPSGRLPDTVPLDYADISGQFGQREQTEYTEDIYVGYRWFETFMPERVRYPFGYGLSYTTFRLEPQQLDRFTYDVRVTNTGAYSGRETVMLFVSKPCGALGNPARELVAFAKTELLAPGESQTLRLQTEEYRIASYDDVGLAGHSSCYVLLEGEYRFYCGTDVRAAREVGAYAVSETRVLQQLTESSAPAAPFEIYANAGGKAVKRMATPRTADRKARILASLPEAVEPTGDRGYRLADVQSGRVTLDEFVAQLSLDELEALSRGDYEFDSPLGIRGNAGAFGGVLESLRAKGIPPVSACDGPSGVRTYAAGSLFPSGTLLAATFNEALVEELLRHVAEEMAGVGVDVLLAPGMNIHRNPLGGRNFEYFSEDPHLTGKIAAAYVRGVQSCGGSACPKHFACNNQELNRRYNNSVVTERAQREIYLKGFEICVREASPKHLMTCYNKINGVCGCYNFDLVRGILRGEWGYRGNVMTDWWMVSEHSPEFPQLECNAYRVRASVDLLMPGEHTMRSNDRTPDGTLLATYGQPDGITLGEMQEAARHVLRGVMSVRTLTDEK